MKILTFAQFILSRLLARVNRALGPVLTGHLPILLSAAAVVEVKGKILLLKRSDGYGMDLPGGIVMWGESPEEAVQREVNEETGVRVTVQDNLGRFLSQDPRLSCVCLAYTCEMRGGRLQASAEGEPMWMRVEQLPTRLAFGNEMILNAYFAKTRFVTWNVENAFSPGDVQKCASF